MTEVLSSSQALEIPPQWKKCTIRGIGGGLRNYHEAAIRDAVAEAVDRLIKERENREATDDDVERVIGIALQDDVPADVQTLMRCAVAHATRAAARRLESIQGFAQDLAIQFGGTVQFAYQEPLFEVGKNPDAFDQTNFLHTLRRIKEECPEIEIGFS
jgi:hypothetical protein